MIPRKYRRTRRGVLNCRIRDFLLGFFCGKRCLSFVCANDDRQNGDDAEKHQEVDKAAPVAGIALAAHFDVGLRVAAV